MTNRKEQMKVHHSAECSPCRRLFAGTNVLNLQLHFAAFVTIFFDGIANVEGAARLDVARLRTLSEGYAVHNVVRLVVHQFQFDVFLSASHHL